MDNTLTGLIPVLYQALDVISRELTGFIGAVSRNSNAERAALGETIRVPVAPTATTHDISPGINPENNGDQEVDFLDMTISKSKYSPVRWNGEEQKGLSNSGQLETITRNRFAQSMRALVNEVEADLAGLYWAASRAHGTAGATPFATDLSDPANMLKILLDNGASANDLHLVIDTGAGAKLRTMAQLTKANEAGSDETLRRGVLLDIHGFSIRESAQVKYHSAGTGAGYVTNLTGPLDPGASALALDTGTGTVLAGDVAVFDGDPNKYLVAAPLSGGSLNLAKPGLLQILADGTALTLGGGYRANLAFDRSAIQLITRAPAMPVGPDGKAIDAADDVLEITDPQTGLAFQVAVYKLYRQVKYEVGLAWGVKAVKPEHMAVLLG